MRNLIFAACSAMAVGACADQNLLDAEKAVMPKEIGPSSSLSALAAYSLKMSEAYRIAAQKTTTTQDVQSLLILLSAAAFVSGAVGSASDAALANRAIFGATTQQVGLRTAPKTAILGMYTGAKRLNCVSSVARVGTVTLTTDNTKVAASALAFAAIEEVRITTRESLVREVADYDALVTAIDPSEAQVESVENAPADPKAIEAFAMQLAQCMKKKPETVE